ncbi:MAG: polyhydroxyalkanoic acid system family protein [Myxococcota bacterium]
MSEVRVVRKHSLTVEEVKQRVGAFEEAMQKYGVKARWNGREAELKGTGVSGRLAIGDDELTVTVKLGLLAKAAGVDVERLTQSIEKRLDAALG